MEKTLKIAAVCGSCSGVRRALSLLRGRLGNPGPPVWLLHDLVHNRCVMADLKAAGVRVASSVSEIPPGALVVLSAHGTPRRVEEELAERGIEVLDAVCPIVSSNRRRIEEAERAGYTVVICGEVRHTEVAALLSRLSRPFCVETVADVAALDAIKPGTPVAALSQTTLEERNEAALKAALRARFGDFNDLGGICGATSMRQRAMREACAGADLAVVIGSPESSNSRKLAQVAQECGVTALLADSAEDIAAFPELAEARRVALTAGASVPEELLSAARGVLEKLGFAVVLEPFSRL